MGVSPPPLRSQSGNRLYRPHLLRWLRFVRRSPDLGFTLENRRRQVLATKSRAWPSTMCATSSTDFPISGGSRRCSRR
ncbi:MAG: hypothetical protein AB7O44_27165 [Hyphomicrobiaceae bacterium]